MLFKIQFNKAQLYFSMFSIAGVDGSGDLFLRLHRVRYHSHDRGRGQQPEEVHPSGHPLQPHHHPCRLRHLINDPHPHQSVLHYIYYLSYSSYYNLQYI